MEGDRRDTSARGNWAAESERSDEKSYLIFVSTC
jgi:hypothetical protein